jgi:hypothetical protein
LMAPFNLEIFGCEAKGRFCGRSQPLAEFYSRSALNSFL